jgi:serpin B
VKERDAMKRRRIPLPGIVFTAASLALACSASQAGLEESVLPRDTSPDASPAEWARLVSGNSAFAFDLYHALVRDPRNSGKNAFLSPYSVSTALAMPYAGARGRTAEEMKATLHFDLPPERLHVSFNYLALRIAARGQTAGPESQPFRLSVANSLWGQTETPFHPDFLDLLKVHYGAGMQLVDFRREAEASRLAVNEWVSDATEERIKDVIPPGAIDAMTRLVLANAIYFKADWKHRFPKAQTRPDSFRTLTGGTLSVDMMSQEESLRYGEGPDHQAVELPYVGDEVSMVLLLPREGRFSDFEASLSGERFRAIVQGLKEQRIRLSLPRFRYEPPESFRLKAALGGLGMREAFDPAKADFTGIADVRPDRLYIQDGFHKGFIAVDEDGTEAAAAKGVVIGVVSLPPPPVAVMRVDRPFLLAIRGVATGTILFLGRIGDPRGAAAAR